MQGWARGGACLWQRIMQQQRHCCCIPTHLPVFQHKVPGLQLRLVCNAANQRIHRRSKRAQRGANGRLRCRLQPGGGGGGGRFVRCRSGRLAAGLGGLNKLLRCVLLHGFHFAAVGTCSQIPLRLGAGCFLARASAAAGCVAAAASTAAAAAAALHAVAALYCHCAWCCHRQDRRWQRRRRPQGRRAAGLQGPPRVLQPGRQAEVQLGAEAAQSVVSREQVAYAAGQCLLVCLRHAAAARQARRILQQHLRSGGWGRRCQAQQGAGKSARALAAATSPLQTAAAAATHKLACADAHMPSRRATAALPATTRRTASQAGPLAAPPAAAPRRSSSNR